MYLKVSAIILIMLLSSLLGQQVAAQNNSQRADSNRTVIKPDSVARPSEPIQATNEIELMEINIEAVIEKPSVAILPRRIEPELGETEFVNRSFEQELKQAPEKPMLIENRLLVPKKIEDFKDKLIKPKKSLKK